MSTEHPETAAPEANASPPATCPAQPAAGQRCQAVRELIALYLPQARRDVTPRAYEEKARRLDWFEASYGDRPIASLRPFDLQCWLNGQEQLRSEWTRRGAVSTVKRLFNWGVDMELIERNPLGRFRTREKLPARRRPMPDYYFQALLRFSPPAWRRFLIFLKFTGCRPGEASSMRWADVRLEDRRVVLVEHKTARSTGKPRVIPLVPTVLKLLVWMRARRQATVIGLLERLLRHGPMKGVKVARFMSHYGVSDRAVAGARKALGVVKERFGGFGPRSYWTYRLPDGHVPPANPQEHGFVFMNCLGNPLQSYNRNCWLARTRKRAGLANGYSLYSLRHRYGFQGIRNKVNLKLLSLAMGHTTTTMTEHYIDGQALADDVQQAAVQAVYGPGAYPVDVDLPRPVPSPILPPAGELPVLTEHVPTRYGNRRPRPHVKADLADVPLPAAPSDPAEQSVEAMMRYLMAKLSAPRPPRPHPPTSSKEQVNPSHEQAYQAVAWAVGQNPALAGAKDQLVYEWLKAQPACPFKLPPTFPTFARYVSAARLYHGTRKRVLPGRPAPSAAEAAALAKSALGGPAAYEPAGNAEKLAGRAALRETAFTEPVSKAREPASALPILTAAGWPG